MATKKDFNPDELITANKNHEQKLAELTKRLEELERRALSNEGFARTFCESAQNNKNIDDIINGIVDKNDKHKLAINGMAVLKWLSGVAVGAIITSLIAALMK